jgi:hypothetical protein
MLVFLTLGTFASMYRAVTASHNTHKLTAQLALTEHALHHHAADESYSTIQSLQILARHQQDDISVSTVETVASAAVLIVLSVLLLYRVYSILMFSCRHPKDRSDSPTAHPSFRFLDFTIMAVSAIWLLLALSGYLDPTTPAFTKTPYGARSVEHLTRIVDGKDIPKIPDVPVKVLGQDGVLDYVCYYLGAVCLTWLAIVFTSRTLKSSVSKNMTLGSTK